MYSYRLPRHPRIKEWVEEVKTWRHARRAPCPQHTELSPAEPSHVLSNRVESSRGAGGDIRCTRSESRLRSPFLELSEICTSYQAATLI